MKKFEDKMDWKPPLYTLAKHYKMNLLQISDAIRSDKKKFVDLFHANTDSDDYCIIVYENGIYNIIINSFYFDIEE